MCATKKGLNDSNNYCNEGACATIVFIELQQRAPCADHAHVSHRRRLLERKLVFWEPVVPAAPSRGTTSHVSPRQHMKENTTYIIHARLQAQLSVTSCNLTDVWFSCSVNLCCDVVARTCQKRSAYPRVHRVPRAADRSAQSTRTKTVDTVHATLPG